MVQNLFLQHARSCKVIDDHCDNLSFHLAIVCSIEFSHSNSMYNRKKNDVNVPAWRVLQENVDFRKSYQESIEHKLDDVRDCFTSINDANQLEDAFRCMCSVLKSAENETVPKTKFKSYLKPFWKCLKSFHEKSRKCRAEWIRHGRPRECSNKYFQDYKNAKRLFRREMRRKQLEVESQKFESLEKTFDLDRGRFYKALAKLRKSKAKSCDGLRIDGKIVTEDADLLDIWTHHYSDLFTPADNPNYDLEFKDFVERKVGEYSEQSLDVNDDILDEPFTIQQVEHICTKLPNGKAGGPDTIVYEHVKYAGRAFYDVLCFTFNAIRCLEDVSDSIVHGQIRNLFKTGKKDKLDKDNYRGITLTNVFSKILERAILERMLPKLEHANIPNRSQFAYQKTKSCVTASFVLQEAISHYVERGSKVYCCFLDTSKAFDTVWIDGLFYKLFKAGIQGKSWRLLKNWYSKLSSSVMHNNLISSRFSVGQGVRQGGVLSPWLFLVYNNDIPEALSLTSDGLVIGPSKCDSILVADDIALLSSRTKGLQRMITTMESYSKRWRFMFNVTKTKIVTFGETTRTRNANKHNRKWFLNELEIEESEQYTHVGILISGNYSSTNRTFEMAKKGREVIGCLMSTGIRPGGLNPIVGTNTWITIGLPRMLYGCELWNYLSQTEIDMLNRTNRFAAKRVQGLGTQTRSEAAIGSVGLWSIEGYIDKAKLLFLGNLCRSDCAAFHKQFFVYRLFYFLNGCAEKPLGFIPDIYKILLKYNLLHWLVEFTLHQTFPSKMHWKKLIVEKIGATEREMWRSGISNKPELAIFGCVHLNLRPLSLWETAKRNSFAIKPIANLVNTLCGNVPSALTLAVNDDSNEFRCKFCGQSFANIAMHFIMNCNSVMTVRNEMWDEIQDILHVRYSAALWNQDDTDVYACFIGGRIPVSDITQTDLDNFIITTAVGVLKIFKDVGINVLTL